MTTKRRQWADHAVLVEDRASGLSASDRSRRAETGGLGLRERGRRLSGEAPHPPMINF